MSRWIDADKMDERRIDYIVDGYAESVADMTEWGMALIEAPSIDIVRCKDCKHWLNEHICTHWSGYYGTIETIANDYCSYGERGDAE